ncbi:MAG: hypothetical protein KTR21_08525 [Rhodobacteraceae bacterium]|nr:hypothetical protein [Paracoccaceae bacterium]
MLLSGFAGAAFLDRKTLLKKTGKDFATAVAVTQAGELLKDWFADSLKDNSMLSPALGSPIDGYMTLDSTDFLSSYASPNYDLISEDIPYEEVQEFAG